MSLYASSVNGGLRFANPPYVLGLSFNHELCFVIPDAHLGVGPESILPVVVMDSGLARFARAPE